tara:strand:+ start:799 stop:1035 length:237 start_codon:yes stop_codon:yes gene_type:complete
MTNNEINQIFEQAIQALKDDYMFMHQSENVLHFKNKITKTYIKIEVDNWNYDFSDKALSDLPDSNALKAIEAHPNYES